MIRWKYLGPRLLVVAAIYVFLTFALDPILRWSFVSAGQAATGARVDLDGVQASLLGGSVSLTRLGVADPHNLDRNLFEVDEMLLDLEISSLLRRKFEVREARLTGLRLKKTRTSSGLLVKNDVENAEDEENRQDQNPGPSLRIPPWLGQASGSLGSEITEKFETVKLTRELSTRWPLEYQQLKTRIDAARKRIDEFKRLARPQGSDILKNVQHYTELAKELDQFKSELKQLDSEVRRLSSQPGRDKSALLAAKASDEQTIREIAGFASMDGREMSEYLLGPEKAEWARTILGWIRWARQFSSKDSEEFQATRGRGRDIVFAGLKQRPDFLIRSMILDGELPSGHEQLRFQGIATGITTHPRRYGHPTVIKIRTSGRARIDVVGVLDRTNPQPLDRFVVSCPHIAQSDWTLGDDDQLAVKVPAGSMRLRANLKIDGDKLSGEVVLRRLAPGMRPVVSEQLGGQQVAARLARVLKDTGDIELRLVLDGTVSKPEYRLQTELGDRLAEAFEQVAKAELASQKKKLNESLNRRLEEYVAKFQQVVRSQQNELAQQLSFTQAELDKVTQLASDRIGAGRNLLPAELGKNPLSDGLNKLFR